jgi:hypothetical protein
MFLRLGVILSGSPYSVYAEDAPHADPALFDLGVLTRLFFLIQGSCTRNMLWSLCKIPRILSYKRNLHGFIIQKQFKQKLENMVMQC